MNSQKSRSGEEPSSVATRRQPFATSHQPLEIHGDLASPIDDRSAASSSRPIRPAHGGHEIGHRHRPGRGSEGFSELAFGAKRELTAAAIAGDTSRVYEYFSGKAAILISIARRQFEENHSIVTKAVSDALEDPDASLARAERDGHAQALITFDLDKFNRVEGAYGHAARDDVGCSRCFKSRTDPSPGQTRAACIESPAVPPPG
jgi:hypothetical protein